MSSQFVRKEETRTRLKCPSCGREGWLEHKTIHVSKRTGEPLKYWYVMHNNGRPRSCYIGKKKPEESTTNDWPAGSLFDDGF